MRLLHTSSAAAILLATAAFPQTNEFQQCMRDGAAAEVRGEYARAAAAYRDATALANKLDRNDPSRIFAWNFLGTMYDALGRYSDGEGAYRRALRSAEEIQGKSSLAYALILGNLGTLSVETGQMAKAEKLLRESLSISSAVDPRNEVQVAAAQSCLAECLTSTGKHREAEMLLTEALKVLSKYPAAWSDHGIALNNLGVVRLFQKRYGEGERLFREALELMEQHLGPEHPMLVRTWNNLAVAESRSGRREAAGNSFARALSLSEKHLGTEHPIYAVVLGSYAVHLRQSGEKSRARALENQSVQILRDASRRNGIGAVVDVNALRGR